MVQRVLWRFHSTSEVASRTSSSLVPLLIQGPTASGKSSLAVSLARQLDGVVVNVDSMQVYADLAVLTARPDSTQLALAPHALYGYVDGAERYGVGQWLEEARKVIATAAQSQRRLIFCGGTGLYAQAMQQGLVETPEINADTQQQVAQDYRSLGHQGMIDHVLARHRQALAHLRVAIDPQRLIRAAEILYQTGKPMIEWQKTRSTPLIQAPFRVVVQPDREQLYARINQRCAAMFDEALEEVTRLIERELSEDLPLMRAIGVKILSDYLDGHIDQAACQEEFSRQTRRYAKRQVTWLRHQVSAEVTIDDLTSPEQIAERSREIVHRLR